MQLSLSFVVSALDGGSKGLVVRPASRRASGGNRDGGPLAIPCECDTRLHSYAADPGEVVL